MGLFDFLKKRQQTQEEPEAEQDLTETETSPEEEPDFGAVFEMEPIAEEEPEPETIPGPEEEPEPEPDPEPEAESGPEPEEEQEPQEEPEPEEETEPEPEMEEEPEPEPEKKKIGFFQKIKQGLSRTASAIGQVFSGYTEIDDDFYDELEESLILADLGMNTTMQAMEALRGRVRENHLKTTEEARTALREILADMVDVGSTTLDLSTTPAVVLVIGVNGVGKTTTIGKIAHQLKDQGKKVLLCAADTFRAAAADQLEIWADRAGVDIIRQHEGADPAAVVFDAIAAAKARHADVILCDTAGRLHNKQNLMNELGKISRIIQRELPDAAREVLLVLDGTTGQNGMVQAKQFREIAGVTGMIVTKLDGTAKGGIVVAVAHDLQIPVKYIGVGEQIDDLMPFEPKAFAEALV